MSIMVKHIKQSGWKPLLQVLLLCTFSITAFAGPPLTVDDAEPVAFGEFEYKLGGKFTKNHANKYYEIPIELSVGVTDFLQLDFGWGYLVNNEVNQTTKEGIGDISVGGKLQLLSEEGNVSALAIGFSITLPTANEEKGLGSGEVDYDFVLISSKTVTETSNAHLNLGYRRVGDRLESDIVHFGVAMDYLITDSLQLLGEIFAEKTIEQDHVLASMYNFGFRYEVVQDIQYWLALGGRVSGDMPQSEAKMGLTFYF